MSDFDLERRRGDEGHDPRTGEDRRMENGGRRAGGSAKYLLDWLVRAAVILITILSTATFAHIRAISDRTRNLEVRLTTLEVTRFTTRDGQDVWQALAQRPTREEMAKDIADIKQMIRDLDRKLADRR